MPAYHPRAIIPHRGGGLASKRGDGATARHHTAETGTAATGRSGILTAKRGPGTVGKERGIAAGYRKAEAEAEQRIQPCSPPPPVVAKPRTQPPCASPESEWATGWCNCCGTGTCL
jgi:hypothetical protein